MKKLILLLLFPFSLFPTTSQAQYKWDDADQHFAAGAGISILTSLVLQKFNVPYPEPKGALVAGIVGITKEFIDHAYHHISWRKEGDLAHFDHIGDAFYTLSGGMTATFLMAIVNKIIDYYKQPDYLMPEN